jgi:hypothetical protein
MATIIRSRSAGNFETCRRGFDQSLHEHHAQPVAHARVPIPFPTSITAIRKSTGGAYVPTVVVGMYAPSWGWPEGTHATTCPRWAFLVPPRHVADPGTGAYIPPKNGGTYAPPADEIRLSEFLSWPEQARHDKEISIGKKSTPEL